MSDSHSAYDDWHRQRQAFHVDTKASRLGPWHRTVEKLLPELPGGRLLEIGCGSGDFALRLAARFPQIEIVATDFSAEAVRLAQARAGASGARLSFYVEDAQQLSFGDNSFDYLISCECMEHVPSPRQMAREMARVLKPGGGFILTTENYLNGCLLAWVKHWLTGTPIDTGSGVQPRENFFVFWMVRGHLQRAGLKVEHMESNHFQWILLPRVSPDRLCTPDFSRPFWRRLFRPFGRHFTFQGRKPARS